MGWNRDNFTGMGSELGCNLIPVSIFNDNQLQLSIYQLFRIHIFILVLVMS